MFRPLEDIRRLIALPSRERRRLYRAGATLVVTSVRLRWTGYAGTRRALERRLPQPGPVVEEAERNRERAARDAWAIGVCADRLPIGTCLERTLALWWLLRRRGIDSDVVFGARRQGAELEAHAWLEVGGTALTDPDEPRETFRELRAG